MNTREQNPQESLAHETPYYMEVITASAYLKKFQTEGDLEAIECLRQEILEGNQWAIICIACAYSQGVTGDKESDENKAMEWLEKAQWHPLGQYRLATLLLKKGVQLDRAIQLLKNSRKVIPDAEIALGRLYASGKHVEKNIEKAKKLFKKAHTAGHPKAKTELKKLTSKKYVI